MTSIILTDCPKSANNCCVIEFSLPHWSCFVLGHVATCFQDYCHTTEADLFPLV